MKYCIIRFFSILGPNNGEMDCILHYKEHYIFLLTGSACSCTLWPFLPMLYDCGAESTMVYP